MEIQSSVKKELKRHELIEKSDSHFYLNKSSMVSWKRYHFELAIEEWVGSHQTENENIEGILETYICSWGN